MEKTCRKCGANNEGNAEICFLCGAMLDDPVGAGPEKPVREKKSFLKRKTGTEAPAAPVFGGPVGTDNAFPGGDGTADDPGFSFDEKTDGDPLFTGNGGASAPADLGFGGKADNDPLFTGNGGAFAPAPGFGEEAVDDRVLPFDDMRPEAPTGFGFDEPGVEPTVMLKGGATPEASGGFDGNGSGIEATAFLGGSGASGFTDDFGVGGSRGNDPSGGARRCPHCGHPIQTNDTYCLNCGGFLGVADDQIRKKTAAGEAASPTEPFLTAEDDWLDSETPSKRKKTGGKAPGGASRVVIPIVAALLSVCVTLAVLVFVFHIDIPVVSQLLDNKTEAAADSSVTGSVTQEDTGFSDTDSLTRTEDSLAPETPDASQDAAPVTDATEPAQSSAPLSLVKGETVLFGYYPQWKVTDDELIDRLDRIAQGAAWHSYDYTDGNGQIGSQRNSDNMRYVDVADGDARYRGVYISDYRPYWSYFSAGSENSEQDDNGYYAGTTYWFRYDPISWIVLDPESGFLMSEYALDAQPHTQEIYEGGKEYYLNSSGTYYACNYEQSYIRQWLNGSFFDAAFSSNDAAHIESATWNNENANSEFRKYSGSSTVDRVALLSFYDATNSYFGFSSDAEARDSFRAAYGTDYAKCQGMLVASNGSCSNLQLRSPGCGSDYCVGITSEGILYEDGVVESARVGIRPVLFYHP